MTNSPCASNSLLLALINAASSAEHNVILYFARGRKYLLSFLRDIIMPTVQSGLTLR